MVEIDSRKRLCISAMEFKIYLVNTGERTLLDIESYEDKDKNYKLLGSLSYREQCIFLSD